MAKSDMLTYWVGSIPAEPVAIDVRDSQGRPKNLSTYTSFELVLLGSDNELIDISDGVFNSAQAAEGRFTFRWPIRSIFNKHGDYLLQLVAHGANGTKDMTTAHTIRVKKLGGAR